MERKRRRKQKSLQNYSKKGNASLGMLSPHETIGGDTSSEKVPQHRPSRMNGREEDSPPLALLCRPQTPSVSG